MAKGRKTGGRVAGVPNKFTGAVRELILAALDGVGGQAYLERQAEQNPAAFMTLLGKVLPMTVQGPAADGARRVTLVVEGVPAPVRPAAPPAG
jgi:hypothetical protein